MAAFIDEMRRDIIDIVMKATEGNVDAGEICAREWLQLEESPTSHMAISSLFSTLNRGGVPRDVVRELTNFWHPKFSAHVSRYKYLSPPPSPIVPYRMFVEAVARKHGRTLDQTLTSVWQRFALSKRDSHALDLLRKTLSKNGIRDGWAERLATTWRVLSGEAESGELDSGAGSVRFFIETLIDDTKGVVLSQPAAPDMSHYGISEYRFEEHRTLMGLMERSPVVVVTAPSGWTIGNGVWMDRFVQDLNLHDRVAVSGRIDKVSIKGIRDEIVKPGVDGTIVLEADAESIGRVSGGLVKLLRSNTFFRTGRSGPKRGLVIVLDTGTQGHFDGAKATAPLLSKFAVKTGMEKNGCATIPLLCINHKELNLRQTAEMIFGHRQHSYDDGEPGDRIMRSVSDHIPLHPAVIKPIAMDLSNVEEAEDPVKGIEIYGYVGYGDEEDDEERVLDIVAVRNGDWRPYDNRIRTLINDKRAVAIAPRPNPFDVRFLTLNIDDPAASVIQCGGIGTVHTAIGGVIETKDAGENSHTLFETDEVIITSAREFLSNLLPEVPIYAFLNPIPSTIS